MISLARLCTLFPGEKMRLIRGLLLMAVLVVALPVSAADQYWVFFGTYTGGKSKGIYRAEFDPATGALGEPQLAAETTSPSFLAISSTGKNLYCVGEVNEVNGKKGGGVTAFALDPKTGQLTKLNQLLSGGAGPCHVALSPDDKTAVVANYGGGSCAFFSINPDGSLKSQTKFFQHEGTGPNKQRQEKAHAHCGAIPVGQHAFVVDLGIDRVKLYRLKPGTAETAGEFVLPPGSGPRHISLDMQNGYAFICGELNSTANVVKFNPNHPEVEPKVVQSLSTLPGGKPVPGNSTAEIVRHPNGKFVYVSNRGHNSIAAFAWDGSKLTPVGHATEGIKIPRNFNIDPTGKWMIVANQDGDSAVVFAIGNDGVPQPTGRTVTVGKPVCVKFVPKAK
jgi:6-phosphogluconolactonase